MDYHKKIVVVPQSAIKIEDDDEEDLESLRRAALQSLRKKNVTHNKRPMLPQVQKVLPQVTQSSHVPYKNRPIRRSYYSNRKQNGNVYYTSPRNPNLIAIVPVDEASQLQQIDLACPVKVEKTEQYNIEPYSQEVSKFHRFKDNGSASEEEDAKEQKNIVTSVQTEIVTKQEPEESSTETGNQEKITENLQDNGEDQKEDGNEDDDDILLMADLEEEDSLERLMDEMEREMNVDKPLEKKEKKSNKIEMKEPLKDDEGNKNVDQKTKSDESSSKKDRGNARSVSPHVSTRINQKRRSLSPRSRSRKKSPRRSPRRSPIRQTKRSPRELTRYRSPRRSPSRYSPRSRSPKLSPRRSPNRTSMKRSPMRKLSPRCRSPKLSSRSRSPRPQRSRSPRRLSRSKSPRSRTPKVSRSRSPRLSRSRSPRFSPLRLSPALRSPRSKSPRSPRRASPRRLASRSRSPLSPPRLGSSRLRSPKASPRRTPPRLRSPRPSPRRSSPWSSPRHSPRLPSPRRRRSPKWSPKESSRKHGPHSATPDNSASLLYTREPSPTFKDTATPEMSRTKVKQKDEVHERATTTETKESVETINDPVLEARRKKFESTRPIDPVNANKKIKLCKKHTTSNKADSSEGTEIQLSTIKKVNKTSEEYDIQDTDLCLETSYEFEDLEGTENTSPSAITSSVNSCVDIELQKAEKEKSSKKRKKRDKELYQVGKLKNELPLSERIGKDKKCKKRKDIVTDGPSEDVESIFEDIAIDEEGDLRAELSRRRAERLNRTVPIQSARLVQSAFKGVVNEVVKNNAKANQRHIINTDEKSQNQKEVRRVTVLHRSLTELHDSEDESTLDSKVPVRFRLGLNKQVHESRESKVTRKTSKRQGRKE